MSTIIRNLDRHHATQLASAMAFDLFLALIPALALAGWALSVVLKDDTRGAGQRLRVAGCYPASRTRTREPTRRTFQRIDARANSLVRCSIGWPRGRSTP